VIVVCDATDPDGDTLVFDWNTDSRLTIKGVALGQTYRYNTFSSSQVFYYSFQIDPLDTAWVQCAARDRKGGSDTRTIRFAMRP
jgi:hypothetical protein